VGKEWFAFGEGEKERKEGQRIEHCERKRLRSPFG